MKSTIDKQEHYYWGNGCEGWYIKKSEELAVVRERMPPDAAEVWHYHRIARQVFYILSGQAVFETGVVAEILQAGESVSIPAGRLHRILNRAGDALEFLVISAPATKNDRIEIIDYAPEFRAEVKKLNYEWLERYFRVEPNDEKSLSNPEEEIIGKGGFIYFVRIQGEIVGTLSLLKKQPGVFELGKMAVTEKWQGLGIGKKLIEYALLLARQKAFSELILYSNRRLANAIYLYRKYGFEEVALEAGLYERADIKMAIRP